MRRIVAGSLDLSLSSGRYALCADGSVMISTDSGSKMLATAVCPVGEPATELDLKVDYRMKTFATGHYPRNFLRREMASSDDEVLVSRVIDRSIRPLFPYSAQSESQVVCTGLSWDKKTNMEVLSVVGASTALMVSDIPWNGPLGAVVVAMSSSGAWMVNPDISELSSALFSMLYVGTAKGVVMLELEAAKPVSEKLLAEALDIGRVEIEPILEAQMDLVREIGKPKRDSFISDDEFRLLIHKAKKHLSDSGISHIFETASLTKENRQNIVSTRQKEAVESLDNGDFHCNVIETAVYLAAKGLMAEFVMKGRTRVDGRSLHELRSLDMELGTLPCTNGSSMFQRGLTQSLCAVSLGTADLISSYDGIRGADVENRFILQYEFPPYSVNEVGNAFAMGRRSIGHGNLAQKAFKAVIPSLLDYPMAIRVNSVVSGSDGSSSMATVCGASLALRDASIPITDLVAGISIGLVSTEDELVPLTDIIGIEDHLGEMDLKLAGTRDGITAVQLDIKRDSVPISTLIESIEMGRVARLNILDKMETCIQEGSALNKSNPIHLKTVAIEGSYIGRLIGPQGDTLRYIEKSMGVELSLDKDSRVVSIKGPDAETVSKTVNAVRDIVGGYETGRRYVAEVLRVEKGKIVVRLENMSEAYLETLDTTETNAGDMIVLVGRTGRKDVILVRAYEGDITKEVSEVITEVVDVDRKSLGRLIGIKGATIAMLNSRGVTVKLEKADLEVVISGVDKELINSTKLLVEQINLGLSPGRTVSGKVIAVDDLGITVRLWECLDERIRVELLTGDEAVGDDVKAMVVRNAGGRFELSRLPFR